MKIKFFFIFVLHSFFTFAQERVNLNIKNSDSQIRVINLKQKGVIHLEKEQNGTLKIKKLDSNLTLLWDIESELPPKTNFIEQYLDDKFLYLLLETRRSDDLIVLKISTSFAASQMFVIKAVKSFEVTNFIASESVFCLAGNVKNQPLLIVQEPTSKFAKYISTELKGESLLQSLDIKEEKIYASFLNKTKKKTEIIFRNYSFAGKTISNKVFKPSDDKSFVSSKFFKSNDKQLLVGNYGFYGRSRDDTDGSQGIFILNIDQPQKIKYYSFDQLKNFFNFLSDRQQERLTKQVKRKKSKGSEYKFNYRLNINELVDFDNNLLLSAEVFVPEFRNNNNNIGNPFFGNPSFYQSGLWGRQYFNNAYWMNNPGLWGYRQRNSQVFDGFKYLEGLVIAFNPDGDIIWDNALPYKNLKYFELKQHLKLSVSGNQSIISYANDNKLFIEEFGADGVRITNQEIEKDRLQKTSKSKKVEFENVEHWYNDYFMNWGIIKNPDTNGNSKMVCFIQKVQF